MLFFIFILFIISIMALDAEFPVYKIVGVYGVIIFGFPIVYIFIKTFQNLVIDIFTLNFIPVLQTLFTLIFFLEL